MSDWVRSDTFATAMSVKVVTVRRWSVDPALADAVVAFALGVSRMLPPAVLYRFYDQDGALLYVGITSKGLLRWAAHAHFASWWWQVATVKVEHYPSLIEAGEAERHAIRTERPRHNVLHARPHPKPSATRRPNHSGSVYQRQRDGRWMAAVSREGRRTLRTCRTEAEAWAALELMVGA